MPKLTPKQKTEARLYELFKRTQQSLIRKSKPYLTAILSKSPSTQIDELINEVHNDLNKNQPEYQFVFNKLQKNYQNLHPTIQQILHQTCPHLYP